MLHEITNIKSNIPHHMRVLNLGSLVFAQAKILQVLAVFIRKFVTGITAA